MTIAVKYCGGCNPRFDRRAFIESLKSDFSGVSVISAHDIGSSPPDLAVVICGCQSRCAEHGNLNGAVGKIIVGGPEDFDALRASIEDELARPK